MSAIVLMAGESSQNEQPHRAIEKGLEFLIADAAKWRKDRECATCHHGTVTVFALSEAKHLGFDVASNALAENAKWTKDRWMERFNAVRSTDSNPGRRMLNSPAIYLALLPLANPDQTVLSDDELKRIIDHLLGHQEEDGSWSWSMAPAKNRPPPFFESDEVATLLTYIALGENHSDDADRNSAMAVGREKAAAWLNHTEPTNTTQSSALRLLRNVQDGMSSETMHPQIDSFIARQNEDGGWGQLDELPSDAYGTGQALYALRLAGIPCDNPAIERGVAFLVATQQDDGSWPMTRRGHPGVTPGEFKLPIIYFGSVWGTMGLMRSVNGSCDPSSNGG
ncbi:MAG: hypothetical protein O2955_07450 [Planctomycetota bacterium]|nr:hypothetical protein [Planctomycetota bacterium]